MIECLFSHTKPRVPLPEPNTLGQVWRYTSVLPVLDRLRQQDQIFKVIPSYMVILRSVWDTQDLVSKRKREKNTVIIKT